MLIPGSSGLSHLYQKFRQPHHAELHAGSMWLEVVAKLKVTEHVLEEFFLVWRGSLVLIT